MTRRSEGDLLTVKEAARELDVPTYTVVRLLSIGRIPTVRGAVPGQPRAVRVRRADLDAYRAGPQAKTNKGALVFQNRAPRH